MKILVIWFLIFVCTLKTNAQVYEHKYYLKAELAITNIQYSTIDQSGPIGIWEKEMGIPGFLSYFLQDKKRISLKMDNYRVRDSQKRPVLVLIHGGAFLPGFGDYRNEVNLELAYQFAQRGYSVFSIEYRLMDLLTPSFVKAGYAASQDAKAALRYITANYNQLNIDPNNIFISGISAGGFTALNAGYLDDDDNIANRTQKLQDMYGCQECAGDNLGVAYKLKGIINIVGGVYDVNQFNNNPNIPVINFHGDNDDIVPYGCGMPFEKYSKEYQTFLSSLKIVAKGNKFLLDKLGEADLLSVCGSSVIDLSLRRLGKTSSLYTVPGGDHSLLLGDDKRLSRTGSMIVVEMSRFMFKML